LKRPRPSLLLLPAAADQLLILILPYLTNTVPSFGFLFFLVV